MNRYLLHRRCDGHWRVERFELQRSEIHILESFTGHMVSDNGWQSVLHSKAFGKCLAREDGEEYFPISKCDSCNVLSSLT